MDALHPEPRKGICGPSCFAIRDGEIFHPITPNPAPFLRPHSSPPPPIASPRQFTSALIIRGPSHPKASFSVEPLSLTIRRSWNLYVPIPRRSYKLTPSSTIKQHPSFEPKRSTGTGSTCISVGRSNEESGR